MAGILAVRALRAGSQGLAHGGSDARRTERAADLDLRREPLDLGEPFTEHAGFAEAAVQSGSPSHEAAGQADDSSGLQSQQSLDDPAGLDTAPVDHGQTVGDLPDVDGLLGSDTEPVDALLMDDYAADAGELSSLDADPADTALLADDAQGDVEGDVESVAALAYTEVWLIPGPYSGRGPTGYDSAGNPTGQEVYSRLTQHGQVDASNIEIIIDNGEVLLDGKVASEEAKRLAQGAVETITDVRSVQNLLQVRGNRDS